MRNSINFKENAEGRMESSTSGSKNAVRCKKGIRTERNKRCGRIRVCSWMHKGQRLERYRKMEVGPLDSIA